MLFWHIGVSVAFVRYAFRDPFMDLRFIALGAVLSDLVDVPAAIPLWPNFQSTRMVGHSTLFAALVLGVVLVGTRRGLWRKRLILLATGVLLHLVLDAMWHDPETLWWPFLGTEFTSSGFATFGEYAREVVTNPWMWAGEAVGLAYLVMLWQKAGLSGSDARATFLRTGVVSAAIDRT